MTEENEPIHQTTDENQGRPSGVLIGCGVLFFVIALIIGLEIFGVISGILFPPDPPIPQNSQLTQHSSPDFGVDLWSYTSDASPCEIIQFYESINGNCIIEEKYCEGSTFNSPGYGLESVATCVGTDEFSIFGTRWHVEISTKVRQRTETTHFDLQREILWSGPAPQATSVAPGS